MLLLLISLHHRSTPIVAEKSEVAYCCWLKSAMISNHPICYFAAVQILLSTQTDGVDVMQKMSSVDHFLALRLQQMWCQAIPTTGYSVQSHNHSDTNRWAIEIQNYVSQQCVPKYKLCVHKPYTLTAVLDCTATKVKHACASKWFSWYLPMQCPNSQIGHSWSANRGMQESSYRNYLPSYVLTLLKFRRK